MYSQESYNVPPSETLQCDFAVVGGGMGGVVAAIAAARHGCQVVLIHDRPVFGGNASSEVNVMIAGANAMGFNKGARESGILEEILDENSARSVDRSCRLLDDVLWEWVSREPNIRFFLNTRATGVIMDGPGRIAGICALKGDSESELVVRAKVVADASGDSVIANAAGAKWRMGREARSEFGESLAQEVADGKVLGCTLPFQFKDTGRPVAYTPPAFARDFSAADAFPHRSHAKLSAFPWWVEWGGELDPIRQVQEIKDELTKIVYGVWDHLKNHGDHGMENYALIRVGTIVGKRESRRVEGPYMLTQQDLMERRRFDDAVAYGGWPIDLHPPEGIYYPQAPAEQNFIDCYEIPLRSLYSKDIANLFLVGRNISVTHVALGSTRVMGTISAIGQAVGTAAALCVHGKVNPSGLRSVQIRELQQTLLRDDAFLLNQTNADPRDLARSARVSATSDAPLERTEGNAWKALEAGCGQVFPVTEGRLENFSAHLKNERPEACIIRMRLRAADGLFDLRHGEVIAESAVFVPPQSEGWIDFNFGVALERGLYWVECDCTEGVAWRQCEGREPDGTKTVHWDPTVGAWASYRGYHIVETAEWVPFRGCYTFRLSPPSRPHTADQCVNGVARATDWPNAWISDPAARLPQSLVLEFAEPAAIGEILLTFDSDLDQRLPPRQPPEMVADYRLWGRTGGKTEALLAEVTGNHFRRRVHRGEGALLDGIRLEVLRTNGYPSAKVFEIRAYAV